MPLGVNPEVLTEPDADHAKVVPVTGEDNDNAGVDAPLQIV